MVWVGGWVIAVVLWLLPDLGAAADSPKAASESTAWRIEHTEGGLLLSTMLQFQLPELVEDALYKGIPMFFVAEAQVLRQRWYWSDRQVSSVARYWRLSYQPLTRRWRLSSGSEPMLNTGLGVTLGQTFDELSDAMAAMQRISRWKIAEAAAVDPEVRQTVNFRFRLDMSQLPRPFQIGAVGRSDWSLLVARSQRWPAEPGP